MLGESRGVGEQLHAGPHAAGIGGEIAAHRIDIVDDDPGMMKQAFARRGQLNAAAAAFNSAAPSAVSRPLIRALADASARWARSAPRVMLRASATAINSWRSIKSKRMAICMSLMVR